MAYFVVLLAGILIGVAGCLALNELSLRHVRWNLIRWIERNRQKIKDLQSRSNLPPGCSQDKNRVRQLIRLEYGTVVLTSIYSLFSPRSLRYRLKSYLQNVISAAKGESHFKAEVFTKGGGEFIAGVRSDLFENFED